MVLDYKGPNGTLRSHLKMIEKQTGKRPPELDDVKIPEGAGYIWEQYWSLAGGDGISYTELAAYQSVTGCTLTALEVKAIMAMDRERLTFIAEQINRKGESDA